MRTTRSNSSPFDSSGVSDRTRDVARAVFSKNAGSPMTQAIPSACAASQVPRIEPRSETDPCTTGTSLLLLEAGTLASGSTARMTGSASAMTPSGVRRLMLREPRVCPAARVPPEPFLPRLGEPVPGLGTVPDDGEAQGRAAAQQHLPLCVGQFLSLVHDDVRERAGQQVRIGTGQCGLIDQGVLEVLAAQHRHQTYAVFVVRGLDQVVDDPGHLLAFSGDRSVMPALTS